MKRWIFIVGIVLIVILASIWVYLLFFSGTSAGENIFNRFNLNGTEEEGGLIEEGVEEEVVVDVMSLVPLRQLTTRKVLAHTEVTNLSASSSQVLFVESGTGHIYSIDLTTGEEERLSNITVPMASKATVSRSGEYAAITDGRSVALITLPLNEVSLSSETLNVAVLDFAFGDDNSFLYTINTLTGTDGKVYDLKTKSTKSLFTLPFRESVILWGSTKDSVHHAYPKTAARLEGYYYKIQNGAMNRLPASGYAFGASTDASHTIYSRRKNEVYETFILDHSTKSSIGVEKAILPEKCTYDGSSSAICAVSGLPTDPLFPDSWYKGLVTTSEELSLIDLFSGAATPLIDLREESGRTIDVTGLRMNTSHERVYFINKIDQALWVFDSTQL